MGFSLANQNCIQNEPEEPENVVAWYVFLPHIRFPQKETTQQKCFVYIYEGSISSESSFLKWTLLIRIFK